MSTDTQYFGPGTRLTVLGKEGRLGAERAVGRVREAAGSGARFCAVPRGCEPKHAVLWPGHPVDRAR